MNDVLIDRCQFFRQQSIQAFNDLGIAFHGFPP
jgi:hypothetical protein